ncbi:DUF6122 family protein [Arenibacter sp. GZD96]|uniref:DUF6122 family protein n=1 Tax=Aurantibrevibacter litoralis TaxID=3106030 RepID=UPI002AFF9BA9|nr:DUF6122 family protein [Arenibacter sp. GZD-96]MEA1785074.1 DUF6122 family protein [Arenibacter sp. GZD-96]
MLRFFLHYGIHFLVPIVIGILFYTKKRGMVILILLSGILIDLDHFLATPVFDATRCSIGFHPLHSYSAIAIYVALFSFPKTRIVGLALLIHILADWVDCRLM